MEGWKEEDKDEEERKEMMNRNKYMEAIKKILLFFVFPSIF